VVSGNKYATGSRKFPLEEKPEDPEDPDAIGSLR
jgi:hypothetical protein